jgi:hypothetical protein
MQEERGRDAKRQEVRRNLREEVRPGWLAVCARRGIGGVGSLATAPTLRTAQGKKGGPYKCKSKRTPAPLTPKGAAPKERKTHNADGSTPKRRTGKIWRLCGHGVQHCCTPTRKLLGLDEVAAAVLGVALFARLHAEGLFLAEADGVEAVAGNAEIDEILLDGVGAAITQREVVLG